MVKLNIIVDKLEGFIPQFEMSNTAISNTTVGWQIEHSLLVIDQITRALERSSPEAYRWKFNKSKFIVFLLGRIPRGKAKAPDRVIPSNDITIDSLTNHIAETRLSIQKLSQLPKDSFFTHPYFGDLRLEETKKLFLIHTRHHIKIIEDILKS